jgi:6-phosphogluconolactonase
MQEQQPSQALVYVGTYTLGESEGIYVYRLDPSSGALRCAAKAAGVENPSFLTLHPTRRYLYAANEWEEHTDSPQGALSAFAIDPETGRLAPSGEVAQVPAPVCVAVQSLAGRA